MARVRPLLLLLALAGAAICAVAAPAAAQRSLRFDDFHSDIVVQPDASLLVTETLRPRFTGAWNGIVRVIDRQHTTAAGERATLDIRFLGATDGDGRPLRHEVNRLDGRRLEFRVWVPDARDRTATVALSYRVQGAIRYFAAAGAADGGAADTGAAAGAGGAAGAGAPAVAYDELYWQVTGTDWEVPIERAGARITLPPGAAPLQEAGYRGRPESGARVPLERTADGIEARGVGPLPPGHGLTVAVAWPAGVVAGPPDGRRSAPVPLGAAAPPAPPHPLAFTPLLLVVLVFFLCYRAWSRRGRDPRERAIVVRWEPPPGLTPAEVGTLVDHRPELHDIISTLVDLAVRGYLRIEEREKAGFFASGKDYRFHLLRPREDWTELPDHERAFIAGLFSGARREAAASLAGMPVIGGMIKAFAGDPVPPPPGALETVRLKDLENEFYRELPKIRDAILNALVFKGHYLRRPDRVRARWYVLAAGAAGVGVFVFISGAAAVATSASAAAMAASFGVAMVAGGIIIGAFGAFMPARTEQGARARESALGFKRFLERVESPRYRRMITSPDQFEAFLPFAMAFRCEEKWAKAFEGLLTQPPDWYIGPDAAFRPSVFARNMGGLASAASSSLSSSPSSSGSGGGGSVGGGSGGGGGGGF